MNKLAFMVILIGLINAVGCAAGGSQSVHISGYTSPYAKKVTKYVLHNNTSMEGHGDLEFQEYCQYIDRAMASMGFEKASVPSEIEMVILVDYETSGPHTSQRSYVIPRYGQIGVSSSTTYGSVTSYAPGHATYSQTTRYNPQYGVTGYSRHIQDIVTYNHAMELVAIDTREKKEMWRTTSATVAEYGNFRLVAPYLVTAMRPYLGASTGRESVVRNIKGSGAWMKYIADGQSMPSR